MGIAPHEKPGTEDKVCVNTEIPLGKSSSRGPSCLFKGNFSIFNLDGFVSK